MEEKEDRSQTDVSLRTAAHLTLDGHWGGRRSLTLNED